MKKLFFPLITSIFTLTSSEIIHTTLLAKNENTALRAQLTLGNKTFSHEQVTRLSQKDQLFLQRINDYSCSLYGTGLTQQIIKQEDYKDLKKTSVFVRQNLIITVKSEIRNFYHHCPCTNGNKADISCESSCGNWLCNGFLTGSAVACVSIFIIGTLFPQGAGCFALLPVPLPFLGGIGAECGNRLHYRWAVKEKQIMFDEEGKELE